MRESKEYKEMEKKWLGHKVKFFLPDILNKKSHGHKLEGPFYGIVMGFSNNAAMIEDRLEGHTAKDPIDYTGSLIVQCQNFNREQFVPDMHAEII